MGAAPGSWVTFDPLSDREGLRHGAAGKAAILCLAGGRCAPLSDNTALALAAIRAGAAAGARVFLASSGAVYGDQPGALNEAAPLKPVDAYGRAKAGMEQQGRALAADLDVPLCILRIGNIAGADAILGGWRPGFRLDRFGDGRTPRRSYVGPQTLARVLGDLVATPDLPDVLNLAAPGMVEMGALLDAAGLDWTARPAPDHAIAEVQLDVRALGVFTPLDTADSLPRNLVTEWRLADMG